MSKYLAVLIDCKKSRNNRVWQLCGFGNQRRKGEAKGEAGLRTVWPGFYGRAFLSHLRSVLGSDIRNDI